MRTALDLYVGSRLGTDEGSIRNRGKVIRAGDAERGYVLRT